MSDLHRIFVKTWTTPESTVKQDDFIPVFHSFIAKKALDEIWIDVTNYAHVKHGPGVILIAHHAHYGMDEAEGRLGLLYARKRGAEGSLADRFSDALIRSKKATEALMATEALSTKLGFGADELLIGVQDHLSAPNTDETFGTLAPAVSEALTRVHGKTYALTRAGDSRGPFTVLAKSV